MKDVKAIILKLMTTPGPFSIKMDNGTIYTGCSLGGLKMNWSNVDADQSFIEIETSIGRVSISPFDIHSIF